MPVVVVFFCVILLEAFSKADSDNSCLSSVVKKKINSREGLCVELREAMRAVLCSSGEHRMINR